MAANNYKFEGWLGLDSDSINGKMVWGDFEPKEFEETDIDIQITHSGMCGSDVHTLRSGWGPTEYPICVGHEIVGRAVRVGSKAEGNIQIGDVVGVGAQGDSCLGRQGDCEACASGQEIYCPKMVVTYGMRHFNGGRSQGGYARYHRAASHFVVKVPDGLRPEFAAPMLCGGVTVFSPLRRHGCGPGKRVGILGVGGLGHFGIVFARAMGADKVVGISRSESKRAEVLEMGADEYIATGDDADWSKKHASSLDLIISTVSSSKVPVQQHLNLLGMDGTFVQVGNPDDGSFAIHPGPMMARRINFTGSSAGSPGEIRDMFALATDKQCRFWVQTRPMSDANQAVVDLDQGKARYRYVLLN